MKPRLAVIFLAASVAMGYGVYKVKYEVRALKVRSSQMQADISREQESIEVLQAEGAYLTRPTRLEDLESRYLDLAPVKPGQVMALSDMDAALPRKEDKDSGSKIASIERTGR